MTLQSPEPPPTPQATVDPAQRALALRLAQSYAKINGMLPSAAQSALMVPLEQALADAGLVLVDTRPRPAPAAPVSANVRVLTPQEEAALAIAAETETPAALAEGAQAIAERYPSTQAIGRTDVGA